MIIKNYDVHVFADRNGGWRARIQWTEDGEQKQLFVDQRVASPQDAVALALEAAKRLDDPLGDAERSEVSERMMVEFIAAQMRKKLRLNRHKAGWDKTSFTTLLTRLEEEMTELAEKVRAGDYKGIVEDEAPDVANFAGMIADNARKLLNEQIKK